MGTMCWVAAAIAAVAALVLRWAVVSARREMRKSQHARGRLSWEAGTRPPQRPELR